MRPMIGPAGLPVGDAAELFGLEPQARDPPCADGPARAFERMRRHLPVAVARGELQRFDRERQLRQKEAQHLALERRIAERVAGRDAPDRRARSARRRFNCSNCSGILAPFPCPTASSR